MNQIKFGLEDAKQVITEMRLCYGKKFSDQWTGVTPNELSKKMVDLFFDLTPVDLAKGFSKMQTQAWPPTLPEFKSWCIGDLKAQWLGANEAWNVARGSIDFNGNELTVVWAKECAISFDAVVDMVKLGDKYQISEAKKVFVERYERMVAESLERGEKPSYQVSYGDDKEQRKTALREAEIAGFLVTGSTQNLIEHIQSPADAKNESVKFKTVAQEHLENIRALLKTKNPEAKVEEIKDIKLFNLPEKLEGWSDPFDDQEQYKKTLQKEGKPIPLTLQNKLGENK